MRIIHLADLHLGKMLHQASLIDIQKELLEQITDYIKTHKIDAIILAGDIYDRSIPPLEAVHLLNSFLSCLINECHLKVYMISGNHDSSERLDFGSGILEKQGLYIETHLHHKIPFIQQENVRFYMLPYSKPIDFKMIDETSPVSSYQEAIAYYMNKQDIDSAYTNILITHHFVGHTSRISESEVSIGIGGSEIIDPHLFESFDYVALGHLHTPQYVLNEKIRYSGSLYKYSFSEANSTKGFIIYDTESHLIENIPLCPSRDVQVYQGYYKEFMNLDFIKKKDDYLSIELLDHEIIPHAIEHLKMLYPYLLKLTYPSLINEKAIVDRSIDKMKSLQTIDLYKDFYQNVSGQPLDEEKEKIMRDVLGGINNEAA